MLKMNDMLQQHEDQILSEWLREMAAATRRSDLMTDAELTTQAREFLRLLAAALRDGKANMSGNAWKAISEYISEISASRAKQGFSSSETAMFLLSLKKPMFAHLKEHAKNDPEGQFEQIWSTTELLDKLALQSTDAFLTSREQLIIRQQEEMMELSTPVVKLWDGVLALPVIGTLDSARTQVVMESLLQAIVATNSRVAIIDITGVPTVDTLVAQHLLKTITAARLMGAECIVSGVRPQIAQTIVHLGINLADVTTKATLADAFALALDRSGRKVVNTRKTPTSVFAKEE
jgi:rsbT co-antagonist protein RsbR